MFQMTTKSHKKRKKRRKRKRKVKLVFCKTIKLTLTLLSKKWSRDKEIFIKIKKKMKTKMTKKIRNKLLINQSCPKRSKSQIKKKHKRDNMKMTNLTSLKNKKSLYKTEINNNKSKIKKMSLRNLRSIKSPHQIKKQNQFRRNRMNKIHKIEIYHLKVMVISYELLKIIWNIKYLTYNIIIRSKKMTTYAQSTIHSKIAK